MKLLFLVSVAAAASLGEDISASSAGGSRGLPRALARGDDIVKEFLTKAKRHQGGNGGDRALPWRLRQTSVVPADAASTTTAALIVPEAPSFQWLAQQRPATEAIATTTATTTAPGPSVADQVEELKAEEELVEHKHSAAKKHARRRPTTTASPTTTAPPTKTAPPTSAAPPMLVRPTSTTAAPTLAPTEPPSESTQDFAAQFHRLAHNESSEKFARQFDRLARQNRSADARENRLAGRILRDMDEVNATDLRKKSVVDENVFDHPATYAPLREDAVPTANASHAMRLSSNATAVNQTNSDSARLAVARRAKAREAAFHKRQDRRQDAVHGAAKRHATEGKRVANGTRGTRAISASKNSTGIANVTRDISAGAGNHSNVQAWTANATFNGSAAERYFQHLVRSHDVSGNGTKIEVHDTVRVQVAAENVASSRFVTPSPTTKLPSAHGANTSSLAIASARASAVSSADAASVNGTAQNASVAAPATEILTAADRFAKAAKPFTQENLTAIASKNMLHAVASKHDWPWSRSFDQSVVGRILDTSDKLEAAAASNPTVAEMTAADRFEAAAWKPFTKEMSAAERFAWGVKLHAKREQRLAEAAKYHKNARSTFSAEKGCGALSSFPNAKAKDYRDGRETQYDADSKEQVSVTFAAGDEIDFKCEPGFTLDGSKDGDTEFKVECLDKGYYEPKGTCVEASKCGALPQIPHAAPTGKIVNHKVEFACQKGYSLDGEEVVQGGHRANQLFQIKCKEFSGEYEEFEGECQSFAFMPAGEITRMYGQVFGALFGASCEGMLKEAFAKDGKPPAGLDTACDKLECGASKGKCKGYVTDIKADFETKWTAMEDAAKEKPDDWMNADGGGPNVDKEAKRFCDDAADVLRLAGESCD